MKTYTRIILHIIYTNFAIYGMLLFPAIITLLFPQSTGFPIFEIYLKSLLFFMIGYWGVIIAILQDTPPALSMLAASIIPIIFQTLIAFLVVRFSSFNSRRVVGLSIFLYLLVNIAILLCSPELRGALGA